MSTVSLVATFLLLAMLVPSYEAMNLKMAACNESSVPVVSDLDLSRFAGRELAG